MGASLQEVFGQWSLTEQCRDGTNHCKPDSKKVVGNVPLYRLITMLTDENIPNAAVSFAKTSSGKMPTHGG